MFRLLMFAIVICMFGNSGFGQNAKPDCPAISVSGPAGVIARPELVTFVANVDPPTDSANYVWTVYGGVVVSGQGTPTISIRPNSYISVQVSATIHVGGLPNKCVNFATESAASVCDPDRIFWGIWNSYDDVTWEEERKSLDELIGRGLQENPQKVAYVQKTFKYDVPWQTRAALIRKIKDYVYRVKKIPKTKFYIRETSLGPANRTWMQLVPENAYLLQPYYEEC